MPMAHGDDDYDDYDDGGQDDDLKDDGDGVGDGNDNDDGDVVDNAGSREMRIAEGGGSRLRCD